MVLIIDARRLLRADSELQLGGVAAPEVRRPLLLVPSEPERTRGEPAGAEAEPPAEYRV